MARMISINELEALRLLSVYTAGKFDIWMLSGNARASSRAHIMSALEGQKVPKSKAGVSVLRDRFYSIAEITEGCMAARQDAFVAWAIKANFQHLGCV